MTASLRSLQHSLRVLQEARECADRQGHDVWQTSVSLQALRGVGLDSDLRCLVCRGYIAHRLQERRKVWRPIPSHEEIKFTSGSRFVITPTGEAFARRLDQFICDLGRGAILSPEEKDRATTCPNSPSTVFPLLRPTFDASRRELRVGDAVIRRFKRSARNQIVVLETFELE